MLLPQMARQLPSGRQILVHHPFHQITEILERHAGARTCQPLIATRQKAVFHLAGIVQIDTPRFLVLLRCVIDKCRQIMVEASCFLDERRVA